MMRMSTFDARKFYADYIEVLNARQFQRLDAFVSDEIVYFGDRATRDQVIAAISGLVEAVPDLFWEVQEFGANGDDLAVRLINRGTPVLPFLGLEPTGEAFEINEFAVYRVRDGRFTHMSNVHDAVALRAQLGG